MQQYKSAHASALTGSVPRKNPAVIEPKSPDSLELTYPLGHETGMSSYLMIDLAKKTVYESSYLATWNLFFACRIVVLGLLRLNIKARQWQTRYTTILERKPLIDTSYHIRHRLELKYFHFAQFLLIAHQAAPVLLIILKK